MKMTLTGRKITPRPSFVERTETKLNKLDKFFDEEASADVTVTQERNMVRVEITIRSVNLLLRAEEVAEDAGDAVDTLIDILMRQIRKNKTRLGKRLRQAAFQEEYFFENEAEDTEFNIVRSKSFPVKPMDVEEAILQMNMIGHQFYMFRNMATGEINVVYRRKDDGYGLLEPDAEE